MAGLELQLKQPMDNKMSQNKIMLPVNKLSVEPVCGEQTGQLMHQNGSGKEIHESHVTSMPEIFIPADPR